MNRIDAALLKFAYHTINLCDCKDNFTLARILGVWGNLFAGVVAMIINLYDPRIPASFVYAFGVLALYLQFSIDRDIARYRRQGAWLALITRRRRRKVLLAGNILWAALPFAGRGVGVVLAFALLFLLGSSAYYVLSVDPSLSKVQFTGELRILGIKTLTDN